MVSSFNCLRHMNVQWPSPPHPCHMNKKSRTEPLLFLEQLVQVHAKSKTFYLNFGPNKNLSKMTLGSTSSSERQFGYDWTDRSLGTSSITNLGLLHMIYMPSFNPLNQTALILTLWLISAFVMWLTLATSNYMSNVTRRAGAGFSPPRYYFSFPAWSPRRRYWQPVVPSRRPSKKIKIVSWGWITCNFSSSRAGHIIWGC